MPKKSKFRNFVIIGNGFDRWQNLPTSYEEFRKYYYKHIDEIVRDLGFQTYGSKDSKTITPVELVYGDAFHPSSLKDEFFWSFETSMALIDDQNLNLYFGKTDQGVYQLQETVEQASIILQKAFSDWVTSIKIDTLDSGFKFDETCYFINFNYTDTLEKRFGVDQTVDYHIHGEASDPETLIFGHATHPEMAFPELMEQRFIRRVGGGKSKRLRGLYLIESALYDTDKHVQDNIDDLCEFMTLDGVHIEDIENIYVLGHSFGEPDFEYFDFLSRVTKTGCNYNELSALWQAHHMGLDHMTEHSLFDMIRLNLLYAQHHRERELGMADISFPKHEMLEKAILGTENPYTGETEKKAKEAVHQRFILEQAKRTKEVLEELITIKGISEISESAQCASVLQLADYIDGGHEKRTADAKWHISYFSDSDQRQIESVMKRIGCANYALYPSIDECIADFRSF
ncbi:MAG: bacteriophage abortive infection AbiH family protein [Lachnospiraceae bacterium]|nr:bacteriophage abortive infection AbiH family protein [Lachnospiraceae bacterium]